MILLLLFMGVVALILVSQIYNWPGAIQPGGVMLSILLFNQPADTFVTYSMNRIFDTAIGVVVALIVNLLLPRERVIKWLRAVHLCKKETKGIKKMKQTIKILAVALALIFDLLIFASCASEAETPKTGDDGAATQAQGEDSLWDAADYTEDTEFGSGKKKVEVKVTAGEKSVTFTLNTDKENLADAMLEHSLVEGEDGPYGLYIKKVNGILADYDIDQTYWSLCQNGEALMNGASEVKISDGESFEMIRTK